MAERPATSPVPTYDKLLWPTLQALTELGGTASVRDLEAPTVRLAHLTDDQLKVLHGNGPRTEIWYRLHWARTYLGKAGALENTRRGVWTLTEYGRSLTIDDMPAVVARVRAMAQEQVKVSSQPEMVDGGSGRQSPTASTIDSATSSGDETKANGDSPESGIETSSHDQKPQRHVWWVNQSQTYDETRESGLLWTHPQSTTGTELRHRLMLRELRRGDLVVHYKGPNVRGIGIAVGDATDKHRPEQPEKPDGWIAVPVELYELKRPIRSEAVAGKIRDLDIPDGPINSVGMPDQGYIYRLNERALEIVQQEARGDWPAWAESATTAEDVPRQRGAWIFQANPGQYDAGAAVRELKTMHWLVNQHKREIRAGDRVFIWQTGQDAGIIAVGELLTDPAEEDDWPQELAFAREPGRLNFTQTRVQLRIDRVIEPPLLRRTLLEHPVLRDLPNIKFTQATNFPVEATQERALMHILEGATASPFAEMMARLSSRGLSYRAETVSAYLLGLQVKRFVILTGISGTGKTQLAMAIASHYPVQTKVSRPAPLSTDAVRVEVQPYMLTYSRVMLPGPIRAALRFLPAMDGRTSAQVRVDYPNSTALLTVSRSPSSPTAQALMFKGKFKEWFQQSAKPGDWIAISAATGEDGDEPRLRFDLVNAVADTEERPSYKVVAVRPDWTDHRGLLGYFNPLTSEYVPTPFLELLLDARDEEQRAQDEGRAPQPFFAILDEMNLAHVEYYFSDFLSALESGEPIDLHADTALAEPDDATGRVIPTQLGIPRNVFFQAR